MWQGVQFRRVRRALILSLLRWSRLNDHLPAGPLRELHLSGPAHVGGEVVDLAVIEFQVPIRKVEI